MAHAGGEVDGEGVDAGCGDGGAGEGGVGVEHGGVGRREVFGEVGQDRCEAVVFVEAGKGAGGELGLIGQSGFVNSVELDPILKVGCEGKGREGKGKFDAAS